jgi:hypothetical protein
MLDKILFLNLYDKNKITIPFNNGNFIKKRQDMTYDTYMFPTTSPIPSSSFRYILLQITETSVPLQILQVGSHEGELTTFFSDYFLDHSQSTLTCIDTFDPSSIGSPAMTNTSKETFYRDIEAQFHTNIQHSKGFRNIRYYKRTSAEFFQSNVMRYDIIAIDESGYPPEFLQNLLDATSVLKNYGVLWILNPRSPIRNDKSMTEMIDKFVKDTKNELRMICKGRELVFIKNKP